MPFTSLVSSIWGTAQAEVEQREPAKEEHTGEQWPQHVLVLARVAGVAPSVVAEQLMSASVALEEQARRAAPLILLLYARTRADLPCACD